MKLSENQKLKYALVTLIPLVLVLLAWGRLQNPGSLPESIAPQNIEAKAEMNEIIKSSVLALNSSQGERALALLEEANKKFPNQMDLQLHLGMAYRKTKKYTQADEVYKKLLEKYPECLPCKNNYAVNLIQMDKSEEALTILTDLIKLDSTYTDVQSNLGIAYEKNGQITQAIAAYQQYLKSIPANDGRAEPAMVRERIRRLEEGL